MKLFLKLFIALTLISTVVVFIQFRKEMPAQTQNVNEKASSADQVLNIPAYPGSIVKSRTEKGKEKALGYQTPYGTTIQDIFDFYDKKMPELGWTKTREAEVPEFGEDSRGNFYKNTKGKEALIWIVFSKTKEKGASYAVESPLFTGKAESYDYDHSDFAN